MAELSVTRGTPTVAAHTDIGVDTSGPPLGLLVLQPTPFCNIDCSYCYLSNRRSTARMSFETLALICRRVFESPRLGSQLEVAWHGGEPLVVPLAWYEDAIALMAERRPASLQLTHRFQSNGVLLNENWARFFARINARVGLSIDGPADLHNANRRTRRGQGTHDKAMRAVRLLQDQGLPFHVITVLTERALDYPERLFDFYVQNGIKEVGFNIEEIEGSNTRSSLARNGVEAKVRAFIRRFFALVWDARGLLKVREFESALGHLLADAPVRDEQNSPLAIVSIGHDGAISTFSPELLGARHTRFGSFAFGHVAENRIEDIEDTDLFRTISAEIRRGVRACECTCRYFRWCGGGAPANKLFETGGFDTTETMHCRLSRQAVFDEVLAGIEARVGPPEMSSDRACVATPCTGQTELAP
jgi:uncharacterized protein